MSTPVTGTIDNPYVGPRTFAYEDRHIYFGREREARSLLARVVSERLLLFYAQSGAGKSSLINTRIIPSLAEEEGFAVLPVGRVGGDLPAGLEVDNVYAFNLMASLDRSTASPGRLAGLTISDFLAHLVSDDGLAWRYDPAPQAESGGTSPEAPEAEDAPRQRFALVIDQFEEIITSHPDRWQERETFFRQLDQALQANPDLWVVLTLREDYVAALDPYAPLLFNRLRARFYMERMGADAALEAIRKPAELGGRPFALGAAEKLADDLRQVRVPGQQKTIAGQYVEPVQLQVVCYQLWENIKGRVPGPITAADLREAGDVDRALIQFYEETLAAALADPAAPVTERQLRSWFDRELVTEAGTRGLVHQDEAETGGLPNGLVRALQRRFLVRAEARGGDTWIELVHDRLVKPIRESNRAWFSHNLNPLTVDAQAWLQAGKPEAKLYTGSQLAAAANQIQTSPSDFGEVERTFVQAGQQVEARRTARQQRGIAWGAALLALAFLTLASWALVSRYQAQQAETEARKAQATAVAAQAIAQSNAALAQLQLDRQAGLALLQEAYKLKEQGDVQGAIEKLRAAKATQADLGIDIETEIADVRRQAATRLAQEGEALAKSRDFLGAEVKFRAALALEPPPDTPVYVYVPHGPFLRTGISSANTVTETLPAYWIQRTEVTNAQYLRCVQARQSGDENGCEPPVNGRLRYRDPQFAKQPASGMTWAQAQAYAAWVGGRLPSLAEWQKACRGGLEIPEDPLAGWGQTKANNEVDRPYPWGSKPDPSSDRLNFPGTGLDTWSAVGSYPSGASPYGALDMLGNVWEWTSEERMARGGSFINLKPSCAYSIRGDPTSDGDRYIGFRVVSPGF